MSDVCAITGKDKPINYKNLVPISTRGSKFIPQLQEAYHTVILSKVKEQFLTKAKEKAESAGELFIPDAAEAQAEFFSKAMTKKPSRNDVITLIKFENPVIIDLIEELRKTL